MVKQDKLFKILPFFIFLSIVTYTWFTLLIKQYVPQTKHYISLVLMLFNLFIYFFNFRKAIFFTGLILLVSTFSITALYAQIVESSFFIKVSGNKIKFPPISLTSLGLLLLYIFFNYETVRFLFKNKLK